MKLYVPISDLRLESDVSDNKSKKPIDTSSSVVKAATIKSEVDVRGMTVDEAIMQMNMIGHSFFVFANSENEEEINVVYVRNDGKYGLIVPEK